MLSRVADSIYWLTRYVERAENIARFVDVNLNLLLDLPVGFQQQWKPLIFTTGDYDVFQKRYGEANADNVIQFLTFDTEYPNSIISCLRAARENARTVREIISSEMWEQVNDFYFFVKDASQQPVSEFSELFSQIKMSSHLFAGIMDSTMSHSEGWHFGQIGRMLERADKTARILDVKYFILLPSVKDVGSPLDELQWIALLRSTSGYEMYRKREHRIYPEGVVKFLVLDREFPRSVQFCLLQAERSLYHITGSSLGTWSNSAERAMGRVRAEMEFTTVEEIIQQGLHEFLDQTQSALNNVGNKIYETFITYETV